MSQIIHGSLEGALAVTRRLTGELTAGRIYHDNVPYEGEYLVIPLPDADVVLETNGKYMEDDVTVVQIPYYETSNVSGMTVHIAPPNM